MQVYSGWVNCPNLIVIKVFPRMVGLMTLLDHHHGKSIKINVSYKIGILDLI